MLDLRRPAAAARAARARHDRRGRRRAAVHALGRLAAARGARARGGRAAARARRARGAAHRRGAACSSATPAPCSTAPTSPRRSSPPRWAASPGRGRIAAFQSVALRLAAPALQALARDAPALRCELVEAEPEQSLPALALGDIDLVLADEWEHQPHPRPPGVDRHDLHRDPVQVVLPRATIRRAPRSRARRAAGRARARGLDHRPCRAPAGRRWCAGPAAQLGGFEPDVRHRANDSVVALTLVASGLAVTLLPEFVDAGAHPGVRAFPMAEGSVHRTIYAATRTADAAASLRPGAARRRACGRRGASAGHV